MSAIQRIAPCLWFDNQAEEAALHYIITGRRSRRAAIPKAQQCGWLKDQYGRSWQVAPAIMARPFADHTSERDARAMVAMLKMKTLDIAALEARRRGLILAACS